MKSKKTGDLPTVDKKHRQSSDKRKNNKRKQTKQSGQKGRKRIPLPAAAACIVILLLIAGIAYALLFYVAPKDVVATVNGYPVTAEELKEHMIWNKEYAIMYFGEEYGAGMDGDFWTTHFGATTPEDYLREYALDRLVRYKLEQQLAVSYGMLSETDISYEAFLEQLALENDRRAEALKEGEIVYGVQEYTKSSYFGYTYSNMQLRLQERMSEKGEVFDVSDSQLKEWYDARKEEYYPAQDEIVTESYSVTAENGELSQGAVDILKEVKKALEAGKTADWLQKQYGEISYQEFTLDEGNVSGIQRGALAIYEGINGLEEGEVSPVLKQDNTYLVFRCLSRKTGGYKDFEGYKDGIRKEYVGEKYGEYVDSLTKNAKVIKKLKFKGVGMK